MNAEAPGLRITMNFHIGEVLSVTTAKLVAIRGEDRVYDLLHWMIGRYPKSHELAAGCDLCRNPLIFQYPWLRSIDAHRVTASSAREFVEHHIALLGDEILPIAPLPGREHKLGNPIKSLVASPRPRLHIGDWI